MVLKIFSFVHFMVLGLMIVATGKAQQSSFSNAVTIDYEHVFIEGNRSPWNFLQIQYEHRFQDLTALAGIKYANRFNRSDYLAEVDLYPIFTENFFAHFNAGTSLAQSDLYANFKLAVTLFHNLTESLIGGAGARYLTFDTGEALIYKATLRWYFRDYLFMVQSFLQVRERQPLGTLVLTGRKYLVYPTYISLKLAFGQAPAGFRFRKDLLNSFSSYLVRAGSVIKLSKRFLLRAAVKYHRNRYSGATARYRIGLSAGITFLF